jgi:ABC-type lipoprotein export system ATPase subunit
MEASKMEVDNESTTETQKTPAISANAPTVLVIMGMAGSGKTTFVQVSKSALTFNSATYLLLKPTRQNNLQC